MRFLTRRAWDWFRVWEPGALYKKRNCAIADLSLDDAFEANEITLKAATRRNFHAIIWYHVEAEKRVRNIIFLCITNADIYIYV